jgi:F5/8 type C domain
VAPVNAWDQRIRTSPVRRMRFLHLLVRSVQDGASFGPLPSRRVGILCGVSRPLLVATAAYAAAVACDVYDGTEQPGPQRAQAGGSAGGVAGSGGDAIGEAPEGGDDVGGSSGSAGLPVGGGGNSAAGGEAGNNGGGTAGNSGTTGNGGSAGTAGSSGSAGTAGSGGSAGTAGSGGSAGTAGSGGTSPCAAHPLTQRSTWTATASSSESSGPPSHAIDGNINDRWSTGLQQTNADWFQVDFGAVVSIDQVTLQLGSNPADFPRGYAVRFSNASNNFAAPVLLSGAGKQATDTVISFAAPVTGRYLLIAQTGTVNGLFWSVAEMPIVCGH